MHRKTPVGAVLVVVAHVAVEHTSQVAFVHDKEAVGALRAHRAHPAFGDGVRVGGPDRTSYDPCTFALPHRVETQTELRVPIAQQELDVDTGISEKGYLLRSTTLVLELATMGKCRNGTWTTRAPGRRSSGGSQTTAAASSTSSVCGGQRDSSVRGARARRAGGVRAEGGSALTADERRPRRRGRSSTRPARPFRNGSLRPGTCAA
jgi:hypothetical protein